MSESLFARPLLIYDDKCYSCAKFARVASALSRGWIRTAGHYYSKEAQDAKKAVAFPAGYDATRMFWLINRDGAFGARSGLPHVVKEIVAGWRRGGKNPDSFTAPACEYDGGTSMSCYTPVNVFKRLATMLSHGASFRFV
ncbi:MAG: hypothetical protein ABI347_04540 [Nitrososphaera sp.]|jgi:hypothetical protein